MLINAHDLLDDEKRITIQQFIDSLPIAIGVKDPSSRYLIGNNYLAELLGLSHGDAIKNIYDQDVNCGIKRCAHLFQTEDALTIKRNRSLTVLCYGLYANNNATLLYGKKYPLIDKNNQLLGCGFFIQNITTSPVINLVPLLSLRKTAYGNRQLGNQFSYIIDDSIPEYDLSKRQMECLFHILRGQSAGDIAITLKIGKRTVETHIDAIKCKLGCDTKTQLIEKALIAGLLNYIPSGFLQTE